MEHRIRLIPSIASADQLHIGDEIDRVRGWDRLHIDIEDGNFVPNITFGEKTVRAISRTAVRELDVHLLANAPCQYLKMMEECGIRTAAAHIEALPYPLEFLNGAKNAGMKAGLALNFATPAEAVSVFSDALDYVIVMTAEPDAGSQTFYPPILQKIRRLRAILPEGKEIWADGGINRSNMVSAAEAGADTLIMGRCVFGADDPLETLKSLSLDLHLHFSN